MSSNYITKIIKNHWILCIGLQSSTPVSRLLTFGPDHHWTFSHISEGGDLVLINQLKHLYLLKYEYAKTEYTLGHKIVLPKIVSHGYSEGGRLYLFDKTGDIYSQTFEQIRQSIADSEDKDGITEDIKLETSNFCSLIAMTTGKLLGHNVVALSDQYYKIRLLERADYHTMLMTTSLRTRFAEALHCHKERRLVVYYDDAKMQLLDENEILKSLNIDTNYVCHPFIGHLAFYELKGSNDRLIIHSLDTNEVHLCELVESDLRISTLAKKSLKADGINHTEISVYNDHVYVTRVPNSCVEATTGFKCEELITEDLKVNIAGKSFN